MTMYQEPEFDFKYFGFWKRVLMRLIDFVILIVPYLILYRLSVTFSTQFHSLIPYIGLWIVSCGYYILMVYRFGGTPGKLIMKARIVDHQGHKLTISRSIRRSVFYILYGIVMVLIFNDEILNGVIDSPLQALADFIAIVYLLSDLFVVFNKKKKALHDFIAGSLVVKN